MPHQKKCFVSCCKQDDRKNIQGFFKVPQKDNNLFVKWHNALGKQNGKMFTKSDHVCNKHFKEEELSKGKLVGSEFIPHSRWILRTGAVPSLSKGMYYSVCYE